MIKQLVTGLSTILKPFLEDWNILQYFVFQACYEIILHLLYEQQIEGNAAVDLIVQVIECFNLSDETYDLVLKRVILLFNEGLESKPRMMEKCFPLFSTTRTLIVELFKPIPKAQSFDPDSFIFIKSSLFFLLQKVCRKCNSLQSPVLLEKLMIVYTSREATTYLSTGIPSLEGTLILEEVIRVIEVASNFTLQQGDQELVQIFCDKLNLHQKYHTTKDFAAIHSQETGQDISFGSNVENMIVQLFQKEFPFDELKDCESELSPPKHSENLENPMDITTTSESENPFFDYRWKDIAPVVTPGLDPTATMAEETILKEIAKQETSHYKRRYASRSFS